MHLFEHGSNRRAWTAQWEGVVPPPQNEEQWIDHLMSLSVEEFIRLAVAVRKPAV
jgi:hypothetical protein